MFVSVHHEIHDQELFSEKVSRMPPAPDTMCRHQFVTALDHTEAACLWEVHSIDELRSYIDPALEPSSTQRYFQVFEEQAVGLPGSQLPAHRSSKNGSAAPETSRAALDPDRLQDFLNRFGADQAAAMHAATVVIGDKLGLYKAMFELGAATAEELAETTGCHPRLVREWANAQVASAYCQYDATQQRYWLTAEQAACLADPESPTFVVGGALVVNSVHQDAERVMAAFTAGGGLDWGEHHPDLFEGTRRFFEPAYRANLVEHWIPALDGMQERLEAGAHAADIGCGHGAALILLAQAFPKSTFVGYDAHAESVEAARKLAAEAAVDNRVSFETATASDFPGRGFDLICVFNALHEWGDPVSAARIIRHALAPDGIWMFTEPRTDDELVTSVRARTFYSVSTFVCTPSALSQDGPEALGAQAGQDALRRVVTEAGFTRFRRAAETPTFMVLEARP
ncbi:class I SAM-dependent methyltransferase [Hoyosella sp. YIM 151337]|uniref:class I SAM-dependent methyltransferase n=1 Tax=Hoyosella sp. YIM 151337 TaxID=2992742 RepID=UPI002235917F|nr:class I SAM-dependent methyltransferase [Hoyosella sp. YIM 151337]MCW4354220.1 class I SAM-dependent methyltransferase [Hoyosella sp. YIM 151337]